jgi:hypothetical protein
MIKLADLLNEETWKADKSVITLDSEKVGDYSFDRDADGFFIDDISGKGQKGFDTKAEMLAYIKKNKTAYLKARQSYVKKGYVKEVKLNENFPGKGAVVLAKDIDYDMMDYFDRMNIKLEVTPISGKKYTASVGPQFGDIFFSGVGAPDKASWQLQLKQIKSVKIIG